MRWRLSAARVSELGYRSNSAARLHSFSGGLDYSDLAGDTQASLRYRFSDDYLKQAGSLTASEIGADRRQNVSRVETDSLLHMVSADARRRLDAGFSLALNGHLRSRLENTPLNRGRASISRARGAMTQSGLVAQVEHAASPWGRRHLLAAGVETAYSKADSDASGAFGGFPFRSGSVVRDLQLGLFVQESFEVLPRRLTLTAGLRRDRDVVERQDKAAPANDGRQAFDRASPRLGANLTLTEHAGLFASLSDAFRSPTADELSALGPFGQAPLKAVKTRSAEAGLRVRHGWGEASFAAFRSITRDEIFAVFDPTAGFGQNRNIDKTRRQGIELELKPKWERFDAALGWSYTEATFLTDFTLDKAPFPATQEVRAGAFLPQVPRHRLALSATARPAAGVSVTAEEVCVGAQHVFGDESNTEPRLGGYCLLGLAGSYEKGRARFSLKIDNALDRRYESRGILGTSPTTFRLERFLVPAPGIRVEGSVRLKLM